MSTNDNLTNFEFTTVVEKKECHTLNCFRTTSIQLPFAKQGHARQQMIDVRGNNLRLLACLISGSPLFRLGEIDVSGAVHRQPLTNTLFAPCSRRVSMVVVRTRHTPLKAGTAGGDPEFNRCCPGPRVFRGSHNNQL